jgi:prepilin-type N-terminal cleavage/methylation domain-containing protein/prepilin-type processing-associated H-X9-DG protein
MKSSVDTLRTKNSMSKGFTLIELLVVIAIIAILASILFPVFGRARENARKTACLSNLKQIGLGLMQYTQDYDEMMPWASYGYASPGVTITSTNDVRGYKWMDVIQPYVKSDQMFTCPSDAGTYAKYTSLRSNPARGAGCTGGGCTGTPPGGSYAINSAYGGTRPATNPAGKSLSVVVSPATTIFAVESEGVVNNQLYWGDYWYDNAFQYITNDPTGKTAGMHMYMAGEPNFMGYSDGTRRYQFFARHLQMGNVLFCDGHAKSHRADQVGARRANSAGKQVLYMWTCEED